MDVKEIWRYPVKSMAGEQLQQAAVGVHGIEGDRVIHVRNGQGKLVTARTYPGLLGHHAKLDLQGNHWLMGGHGINQVCWQTFAKLWDPMRN